MPKPGNIAVVSHRRSGTHLTIDSLINNAVGYGADRLINIDQTLPHHEEPLDPAMILERAQQGGCIFKSHALPDVSVYNPSAQAREVFEYAFGSSRVLHVVRNGLDVMVSLYEYIKLFDDTVRAMDFSSFLRTTHRFDPAFDDMNVVRYWSYHTEAWQASPFGAEAQLVRFEDWIDDFEGTLHDVLKHVDARKKGAVTDVVASRKPPSRIDQIAQAIPGGHAVLQRLRRLVGAGVTRTSVALRKGKTGDHRNYFSESDLEFFHAHGAAVMEKLGYSTPAQS